MQVDAIALARCEEQVGGFLAKLKALDIFLMAAPAQDDKMRLESAEDLG